MLVHQPARGVRPGSIGAPDGPAASGDSRGRGALVQRGENRERVTRAPYVPVLADLADGELVARPVRSGGAFDPLGCRACDVERADDVWAIAEGHPGRWLMVTLTIDRKLWLGPEEFAIAAAYQRCNERVREVTRRISLAGIHVTALELQGKTGDGWPHWHLIVWAPDDRAVESIAQEVKRAWCITDEHVDQDTGDVSRSRVSIGRVDVQEARTREGVCKYAAKYVVKPWPSLPAWMGESRRQLRKLRISSGCFDWLEAAGRHVRHRGGRMVSRARRRPARRLFDRMASSGSQLAVFRRDGDRLCWVCTLPVPACGQGLNVLADVGGEVIRFGSWSALRVRLAASSLDELKRRRRELVSLQRSYIRSRRWELEVSWDLEQERRSMLEAVELERPSPSIVWDVAAP